MGSAILTCLHSPTSPSCYTAPRHMSAKRLPDVSAAVRQYQRFPSDAERSCAGRRFLRGLKETSEPLPALQWEHRQYGVPVNAHKEESNAQKPVPERIG